MRKLSPIFSKGSTFAFAYSLLSAFLLSGCLTEPKFPVVPEIRFESIRKINLPPNQQETVQRDSVIISIHFQDGDGDLGLSPTQLDQEPWKDKFNYKVETFVKRGETWEEYRNFLGEVIGNSGNFPPLVELGSKPNPIEGILDYSVKFSRLSSVPNDTVKFRITITDRALHESLPIETDPIDVYGL